MGLADKKFVTSFSSKFDIFYYKKNPMGWSFLSKPFTDKHLSRLKQGWILFSVFGIAQQKITWLPC